MALTSQKKKKLRRPTPETTSPPVPTARRCRRSAAVPAAAAGLLLLYLTWRNFNPLTHPPSRFYSFDIVNEFPHDPDAFTQGLSYGGNDTLFESTGLYQRSSVRQVHLQTGKHHVPAFGGFIIEWGRRLQLIYKILFQALSSPMSRKRLNTMQSANMTDGHYLSPVSIILKTDVIEGTHFNVAGDQEQLSSTDILRMHISTWNLLPICMLANEKEGYVIRLFR